MKRELRIAMNDDFLFDCAKCRRYQEISCDLSKGPPFVNTCESDEFVCVRISTRENHV